MRSSATLFLASFLGLGCGSPTIIPAPPPPPIATGVANAAPATTAGDMALEIVDKRPPIAAVREVRDDYFGKEVIDPYRWMETDSDEYSTWMKAQADFTRRAIDELNTRQSWLDRLMALDNAAPRVRGVWQRGNLLFSLESEPGQDAYILYVRDNPTAEKRVLLDPRKFVEPGKTVALDYWVPSPNGSKVAFGLSKSGSEMAVLSVIETKTAKVLPDSIDRARYASVSWLDEKSFFYKRDRKLPADAPPTERFTKARVHRHVVGTDPETDVAVFGAGVNEAIEIGEEAFPAVVAEGNCPYAIATLEHGVQPDASLFIAPKTSVKDAKTPWRKIVSPSDKITDFDVHGKFLYAVSHQGAPKGKIIKINLDKPDLTKAETVIPESTSIITRIGASKDALYVRTLDAGMGKLVRLPFDTHKPEPVNPGMEGTVSTFSTNGENVGAFVRVESWTASPALFALDPVKKKIEKTRIIPPSPVTFQDIVASEVMAKSADGTMVPLSILHRRDLPKDGTSPTYLNGYASYGNVYGPFFDPMSLAWLEKGFVMAYCHARGGGEFGEDWHNGGKLATKPNTVLDFIACGEYLVQQKYTSPAHLAGQGTSAGGILIGGAIVRRPDLFGAAVIRVGMVNALRFEQIPIGPFNIGEFGTVKTKDGFEMLWNIDAYHNVVKGKQYPAVLLTTGITDPRVSPWQMAKMAARLQASTSGKKPVLLRVDFGSGHGIGTSKTQYAEEVADTFAFLESQLRNK
jgi:prolyl oligopeptidase